MSKTLKDRPLARKESEADQLSKVRKPNRTNRAEFNRKLNHADYEEFEDLPTFEKM